MIIGNYAVSVSPSAVVLLICYLAGAIVTLIALVRIIQKAGYSGWWVIILFVPIINIIAIWYFGFSRWPGADEDR
jgi:hypothetical protein